MTGIRDVIYKKQQAVSKIEPKRKFTYGVTVGGDYADSPAVTGRPGFVWVRENGQNGGVFQCFNPSVKLVVGLPVIMYRETATSRLTIRSVNWDALEVSITSSAVGTALGVPNHARDHEWITMFPGFDAMNVYPRAMTMMKIYPGATALTMSVASGYYMLDGDTIFFPGLVDDDITSYIPSTAGNRVSVLMYINTTSNLVEYLSGTESVLLFPVEPTIPADVIPLGFIRLYEGMAGVLDEDDITNDPRPFISIATGGTGGGDVYGTATAADGNMAVFDADGYHLKDGGPPGTGGGGGGGDFVHNIDGRLATATTMAAFVASKIMTITKVYLYGVTLGSSSSTIVDIHKNGTTIFTNQANRPTLAYDDADHVAISGTPDIVSLSANDFLTIDIDQVAVGSIGLAVIVGITVTGGTGSVDILEVQVFS